MHYLIPYFHSNVRYDVAFQAPYMGSLPQTSSMQSYSPYGMQAVAVPSTGVDGTIVSQPLPGVIPTALTTVAATQQKLARADRLEVGATRPVGSVYPGVV